MPGSDVAYLYPPPVFDLPAANVRLVRDFTQGRQWGVDVARYGKPYVFGRISADAAWVMFAGPFADESGAESWIAGL